MATFLAGDPKPHDSRFAVVVARFNADVTEPLLTGCLQTFASHGLDDQQVDVARVPGAFELPLACERLAASGRYAAVIALGCVLRGGTPHFDYVCAETCRGLMDAGLRHGVPVVLGVLTCDTLEQAQLRSSLAVLEGSDRATPGREVKSTPESNKGAEAAATALEMAGLLEVLR